MSSANEQEQQELLQNFKGFKDNMEAPIVRKYHQQVDDLCDELAAGRAQIKDLRAGSQDAQGDLDAGYEVSPSQ